MDVKKLKYVIAVLIYGTIGLVLHYVNVPSSIVVMCRAIIGTAFIAVYMLLTHRKPDGKAIKSNLFWLVISGVSLGLNWVFLFEAYVHTSVAIASLCNYMAPIIVLALSPLLFKTGISLKNTLCVLAAIIGIVLVSGVVTGNPEDVNVRGIVLGLLSAGGFVMLVICNKKIHDIGSYDKALIQLLSAACIVTPYAIFSNIGTFHISEVDLRSALLVIMLGLVHTGIAYILYFDALGSIPVVTVAVLGYLEPVLSILLSAFVLNEACDWYIWVGAILIIGAAVISELNFKRPSKKTA